MICLNCKKWKTERCRKCIFNKKGEKDDNDTHNDGFCVGVVNRVNGDVDFVEDGCCQIKEVL